MQKSEVLQIWGTSFQNKLVAIKEPSNTQYSYSGLGLKRILIVALPQTNNTNDHIILEKIIQASKLTMDDIFYVNAEIGNLSLSHLHVFFNPAAIVFFNVTPKQVDLFAHIKQNKAITWLQSKLMFCVSLETINSNKELKLEFWNAWQQMIKNI